MVDWLVDFRITPLHYLMWIVFIHPFNHRYFIVFMYLGRRMLYYSPTLLDPLMMSITNKHSGKLMMDDGLLLLLTSKANRLQEALGLTVLKHKERKPGGGDDIKAHFGHSNVAVVGDRYLTDILMAKSNGFFAIYVEPFDVSRDNPVVRSVRVLERALVKMSCRQ